MYATNGGPARARWAVMWIYKDRSGRKKVARKNFGDDYASAEALFRKALLAEKPVATLACVNMGFPPPVELRPHVVRKRGRDKRTRKIRVVEVEVAPLKELNIQGKLWCPYCRAVRPFIRRNGYKVDNIRVPDAHYACPICGVSHRDHNVRQWNPTASIHMGSSLAVRTRRSRKPVPRRRRRVRA